MPKGKLNFDDSQNFTRLGGLRVTEYEKNGLLWASRFCMPPLYHKRKACKEDSNKQEQYAECRSRNP